MTTLTVMNLLLFALLLVAISNCMGDNTAPVATEDEEDLARKFLLKFESEVRGPCHQRAISEWNFHTNLTEFNRKKSVCETIYAHYFMLIFAQMKSIFQTCVARIRNPILSILA